MNPAPDDYYYNYDNFNFYTGEAGDDDYVEQCLDFYTGEYSDCPDEEESESSSGSNNSRKDEEDDDKSDADSYPPEIWCDLVGTLNNKCGEYSLLEIWSYDRERISKLTQQGRKSIALLNILFTFLWDILLRYSSACGRFCVCFVLGSCMLTESKTKHTKPLPQADEQRRTTMYCKKSPCKIGKRIFQ